MKILGIGFVMAIVLFVSDDLFAQRHRVRHDRRVVVRHSRFRPRKVVVFRPAWYPRLTCQRRWVYFPRYNFYWDNWRNHYLYFNGTVWLSKSDPPPNAKDIVLAEEKFYELDETDDDNDDIALANSKHKEKYKGSENP